eukprot:TRINITY_DN2335_c0_g3_i1.p1 TRINITY_DN2335_c0_g3~~TRINITY_DN2335_c0_g3_i1.p1  ORF type:complete len:134 (-),score=7.52 TRINITY_DN2335_c0_g3_i1:233-634(-)
MSANFPFLASVQRKKRKKPSQTHQYVHPLHTTIEGERQVMEYNKQYHNKKTTKGKIGGEGEGEGREGEACVGLLPVCSILLPPFSLLDTCRKSRFFACIGAWRSKTKKKQQKHFLSLFFWHQRCISNLTYEIT